MASKRGQLLCLQMYYRLFRALSSSWYFFLRKHLKIRIVKVMEGQGVGKHSSSCRWDIWHNTECELDAGMGAKAPQHEYISYKPLNLNTLNTEVSFTQLISRCYTKYPLYLTTYFNSFIVRTLPDTCVYSSTLCGPRRSTDRGI